MNYLEISCAQRSVAWFASRCGRLTGSRAGDMLASIKTGEAAARRDYKFQLVTERLTGHTQEDAYVNDAMKRGIEKEPAAIAAYEAATGQMVQQSGFLSHTKLMAGCSLDGHVGDYAKILEIKCPKSATHFRYLRAKTVPPEHLPQIRHNAWITGAEWVDFVSFDDRFAPKGQLVIIRVMAAELDIPEYERAALKFLAEVQAEYESVMRMLEPETVVS